MTKSKVVFDPFSEEFFTNPFDIYQRMREDAPLYYDEKEDFYALTRHEDVAGALKDFETYSSTRGCDLAMVRKGISEDMRSIIFMDPPDHRHMRSLLNKAFTPRAIQSQMDDVHEVTDKYLGAVDPDNFDVVQDFSGPFPVEVITRMAGVPEEYRQQLRHWIDISLSREPGQIEVSEAGMQANIDSAMYYYGLVQERREDPQDDMISRLIAAEIPSEDGTLRKLKEDRSKVPAAVEELLRYEGPVQYNVRYTLKEAHVSGGTIPPGKPVFVMNAAANRDPDAFTDADTFNIDRDQTQAQHLGLGYGIHSCLGAALARMESRIALEKLLDFMPHYEVQWDDCKRVTMQNVAGWLNVPVKVLR